MCVSDRVPPPPVPLGAFSSDCLPPHVVSDHRLAPELLPGDRLVAVTCTTRRPHFGEYVLIRDGTTARHEVVRYVAPAAGPTARTHAILVWTGDTYRHVPVEQLRGRILSVVRAGRTRELRVTRGWAGRDRLAAAGHRILDRLRRWLVRRTAQEPAARAGR